ncbi:hypothetical protein L208DRAFT_835186 [Tricholoma matsutake]|nr:hypothetical protein L208DRAFT_835186 [Tricholoma matsutake 945]
MSSSVASCSFSALPATGYLSSKLSSKNPGLSLNLNLAASSNPCTVIRRRSSVFDSLTNTPDLEPSADSDSDSDSSDADDEDDEGDNVQYVYIPADSPFHRSLSTPRTSTCPSFTGFPFACDALAEEDPLFMRTPGAWFDEELQHIVSTSGDNIDSGIFVRDNEQSEPHSQCRLNWPSPKPKDTHLFSEHARRSSMVFDDDELRPYL